MRTVALKDILPPEGLAALDKFAEAYRRGEIKEQENPYKSVLGQLRDQVLAPHRDYLAKKGFEDLDYTALVICLKLKIGV